MITRCPSGFNSSFNSHCCCSSFRGLRTINLSHRHRHVSNTFFDQGPSDFFPPITFLRLLARFRRGHVTTFYVATNVLHYSLFLESTPFHRNNLTEILSFFRFMREIWRSIHVFLSRFLVMKVASSPFFLRFQTSR